MRKLLAIILGLMPTTALADAPARWQISGNGAGVTYVSAQGEGSTRNMAALNVAGIPYLALHYFHDDDGDSTAVKVQTTCYGGFTSAVTSSTGYALQHVSVSSGTGSSSTLTIEKAVSADTRWVNVWDTRGVTYVICYFAFANNGGAPEAGDTLTVIGNLLTAP